MRPVRETPGGPLIEAVGRRVTLRVRTPAGPTDLVGLLVDASTSQVLVRRRDGSVVTIPRDAIAAWRVVPPPAAETIAATDLERVAALGWIPAEVSLLGDWQLRATGGFTGRANSALAVGDPGGPVEQAAAAVIAWYAARGLPPLATVIAGDGCEDGLTASGWTPSGPDVHVMTAEIAPVLRAHPAIRHPWAVSDAPDRAWLATYRAADHPLPPAAERVLTDHPRVGFVSIVEGGATVAIARVAADDRWAGIFAVEVDPSRRRTGLGSAVTIAALQHAVTLGARRSYLQVASANAGAVALYDRLGFGHHHDYRYLTPPADAGRREPTAAF